MGSTCLDTCPLFYFSNTLMALQQSAIVCIWCTSRPQCTNYGHHYGQRRKDEICELHWYVFKRLSEAKVDDGTGLLPCISWFSAIQQSASDRCTFQLGDCVTIQGRLQEFKNVRQLVITRCIRETDPNMELIRWCHTVKLQKQYEKEYQMPENLQEQLAQISNQLGSTSTATRVQVPQETFELAIAETLESFANESDLIRLLRLWIQELPGTTFGFQELTRNVQLVQLARHIFDCRVSCFFFSKINTTAQHSQSFSTANDLHVQKRSARTRL